MMIVLEEPSFCLFFFHYSVLATILNVIHFINEERKTIFFKREDMSEKVIEIKSVGK